MENQQRLQELLDQLSDIAQRLGLSDKLTAINEDIMRRLGRVEEDQVTDGRKAILSSQLTHEHETPFEQFEYKIGKRLRSGFVHKEVIDRRVTGVNISKTSYSFAVSLSSELDSDTAQIEIGDTFSGLVTPQRNLPDTYSIESFEMSPGRNGVRISFNKNAFDPAHLGRILDDVFLQSGAARLPHVGKWLTQRTRSQNMQREMERRIGRDRILGKLTGSLHRI